MKDITNKLIHSSEQRSYIPQPVDTTKVVLEEELLELTEMLAKNTHEVWAAGRIAEGWVYGPERNDKRKEHPGIVPYEELTEEERQYDRNTAMETLRLIRSMGFEIGRKSTRRG